MDEDNQDQPDEKKHAISTFSFIVMLGVAAICDAISFGLALILIDGGILNDIFVFIVGAGIWLWTFFKGMGFKGFIAGGVSMVIEFIPVLNTLPTFTAEIVALFIYSRVTEKALGKIAAESKTLSSAVKIVKKVA
jgi:hypothetical protein